MPESNTPSQTHAREFFSTHSNLIRSGLHASALHDDPISLSCARPYVRQRTDIASVDL